MTGKVIRETMWYRQLRFTDCLWLFHWIGLWKLFWSIIFGIVERKIVSFRFINGDFALSWIHFEVLDGINLGICKLLREQGLYEDGLIIATIKFGIHETGSNIPHKMTERNTRNLLGQSSFNWFRFIVGIVHPIMHLGADMVDGLFVCYTRHYVMNVLHYHTDTLLHFQFLHLLIRSLSLLMMLRGDVDFNRLGFLGWLFIGYFFSNCGFLSHRSNNLLWCNWLNFQWFVLFAEL